MNKTGYEGYGILPVKAFRKECAKLKPTWIFQGKMLLPNEASEAKVYFRFRASTGKIEDRYFSVNLFQGIQSLSRIDPVRYFVLCYKSI